jgi:hypothetical protein
MFAAENRVTSGIKPKLGQFSPVGGFAVRFRDDQKTRAVVPHGSGPPPHTVAVNAPSLSDKTPLQELKHHKAVLGTILQLKIARLRHVPEG